MNTLNINICLKILYRHLSTLNMGCECLSLASFTMNIRQIWDLLNFRWIHTRPKHIGYKLFHNIRYISDDQSILRITHVLDNGLATGNILSYQIIQGPLGTLPSVFFHNLRNMSHHKSEPRMVLVPNHTQSIVHYNCFSKV